MVASKPLSNPRDGLRVILSALAGVQCTDLGGSRPVTPDLDRCELFDSLVEMRELGRGEDSYTEIETPETFGEAFPAPAAKIEHAVTSIYSFKVRLRADHADSGRAETLLRDLTQRLNFVSLTPKLRALGLGYLGNAGVSPIGTKWGPRQISSAVVDLSFTYSARVADPELLDAVEFVSAPTS